MSTTDNQTSMTAEEAIEIIEREIACVNKECNIERACGQCELVMPSKEPIIGAYKLAIEALKAKPCEDCVSRQAVLELIRADWKYDNLEPYVENLPPVNLCKPKTGHWVEENVNEWSRKVFCSECGCQPPFEHVSNSDVYSTSGYGIINKTKFCPNCGTRMFVSQGSEVIKRGERTVVDEIKAIKILSQRDDFGIPCGMTSGYPEAIDTAIRTLKEVKLLRQAIEDARAEILSLKGDNFPNNYYVKIIDKHLKEIKL